MALAVTVAILSTSGRWDADVPFCARFSACRLHLCQLASSIMMPVLMWNQNFACCFCFIVVAVVVVDVAVVPNAACTKVVAKCVLSSCWSSS